MKTFNIQRLIDNLNHQCLSRVLLADYTGIDGRTERFGEYLTRVKKDCGKAPPKLDVRKLMKIQRPYQRLIALICCEAITADELATFWFGKQIEAYHNLYSMAVSRVMLKTHSLSLAFNTELCEEKVVEFWKFILSCEDAKPKTPKLDEDKPLPPDVLVEALQDKVHTDVGNARKANSIKVNKECKDGVCKIPANYFDDLFLAVSHTLGIKK